MRHVETVSSVALGAVLLFIGVVAFRIFRILSPLAAISAGTAVVMVGLYYIGRGLWPVFRRLSRDPYSLDALREAEEQAQNQAIEGEEMEGVYCPTCGEVYPDDYHICPRCGRPF